METSYHSGKLLHCCVLTLTFTQGHQRRKNKKKKKHTWIELHSTKNLKKWPENLQDTQQELSPGVACRLK